MYPGIKRRRIFRTATQQWCSIRSFTHHHVILELRPPPHKSNSQAAAFTQELGKENKEEERLWG